jgi:serine/threonine protein kinase
MQLQASIRHPALLPFRGFTPIPSASKLAVLFPFMANGSLDSVTDLSPTNKVKAFIGLSSALLFLHGHNIVHGTLNLSNILVDEKTEIRIAQFAKLTPNLPNNDVFTAPEVLSGSPAVKKSDIFSLGLIFFSILTGTKPVLPLPFAQIERPALRSLIEECARPNPSGRPAAARVLSIVLELAHSFPGVDAPSLLDYIERLVPEEMIVFKKPADDLAPSSPGSNRQRHRASVRSPIQTRTDDGPPLSLLETTPAYTASLIPVSAEDMGRFEVNIADYEVINSLGSGAWGDVFLARDVRTGDRVAIKRLKKRKAELNQEKNFNREAMILAMMNHPAVLRLLGYTPWSFEDGKFPRMLVPYMAGGSLESVTEMERQGTGLPGWNATQKLIALIGAASGMMYLHENSIIHRDLKPENVLLNEFLEPRICDFGFSKVVDVANAKKQSLICGTGRFMAPELYDELPFDFKVDVYAFGVMVYEVLTLEVAFGAGTTDLAISGKVLEGKRPELPASLPEIFRDLIGMCWAQQPEERPDFNEIVMMLGKEDVLEAVENLDLDKFLEYQSRAVPPDLIPGVSVEFAARYRPEKR